MTREFILQILRSVIPVVYIRTTVDQWSKNSSQKHNYIYMYNSVRTTKHVVGTLLYIQIYLCFWLIFFDHWSTVVHTSEVEFEFQQARGPTACKVRNKKEERGRLLKKQGVGMYNGVARLTYEFCLLLRNFREAKNSWPSQLLSASRRLVSNDTAWR